MPRLEFDSEEGKQARIAEQQLVDGIIADLRRSTEENYLKLFAALSIALTTHIWVDEDEKVVIEELREVLEEDVPQVDWGQLLDLWKTVLTPVEEFGGDNKIYRDYLLSRVLEKIMESLRASVITARTRQEMGFDDPDPAQFLLL